MVLATSVLISVVAGQVVPMPRGPDPVSYRLVTTRRTFYDGTASNRGTVERSAAFAVVLDQAAGAGAETVLTVSAIRLLAGNSERIDTVSPLGSTFRIHRGPGGNLSYLESPQSTGLAGYYLKYAVGFLLPRPHVPSSVVVDTIPDVNEDGQTFRQGVVVWRWSADGPHWRGVATGSIALGSFDGTIRGEEVAEGEGMLEIAPDGTVIEARLRWINSGTWSDAKGPVETRVESSVVITRTR